MSKSYDIGCVRCQEYIWVGQSRSDGKLGRLYTGRQLQILTWLDKHRGHPLVFDDACESSDFHDMQEWDLDTGALEKNNA